MADPLRAVPDEQHATGPEPSPPQHEEHSSTSSKLMHIVQVFFGSSAKSHEAEKLGREITKLHKIIERQDEMKLVHQENVREQKKTIDSQLEKIQAQEGKIRQLERQISRREERIQQYQQHQSQLQSRNHKHEKIIEQQQQEISSLVSRLESTRQKEMSQEAQIREVQLRAFENMNEDTWMSGDDGTIRLEVESLQSRIKGWARRHAVAEMNSVRDLDSDEFEALLPYLAAVMPLGGPGSPSQAQRDALRHLSAPHITKKSPAICLQALLSHCVYTRIIAFPFLVFGSANEPLQAIYDDMRSVNERDAHIWRSTIIRLLAIPITGNPAGGTSLKVTEDYAARQLSFCQDFTSGFLHCPVRHLIRDLDLHEEVVPAFESLRSIVQFATEVSSRLWSRRTSLQVQGLSSFQSTPFSVESGTIEAHPIHRLYDGDTKCDGWQVSIVVHPAVVGFGSSDGNNSQTQRVWIKAQVLLTEPAPPKLRLDD